MELAHPRQVTRFEGERRTPFEDQVVVERPIELRLGGTPLAVLMCSPGMEAELARGFAITEGIILSPVELDSVVQLESGDRYELVLASGVEVDAEQFRRNAYTTSSCGVCGKASIDAVRVAARTVPTGPALHPSWLAALPDRLGTLQTGFQLTGGLHAAGLFDAEAETVAFAEDVGRHNAVDKAIGAASAGRWPLGELVMQVSGRISFELVQKAAVAGIPVVSGVSAASSLAAELADELGLTLVGFVRDDTFVVYADPGRILA